MRFKEILTYIDSYNISNKKENNNNNIILDEENKIYEILTKERISKYKEISEAADEKVKKIKIEESSLFLFQNEIKSALCEILKEDLFDDIFNYLYKIYIIPYFEDVKQKLKEGSIPTDKPLVRQKLQFLLAIYFNEIWNMNPNNFDHLFAKIIAESGLNRSESLSNQIL